MTTDTYHVKWHSYSSHLNGSVGALLLSERFTDVVLCTLDGSQIPAHKFILSSCSVYLSSLFDGQRSVTRTGGMLYVVLPSEISTKALKILVEYMYKGEIKISDEDLDTIMKAGDVLKVRGIWKNIRAGCDPDLTIIPEKSPRTHSRQLLPAPPKHAFYNTDESSGLLARHAPEAPMRQSLLVVTSEPSCAVANVTHVPTNSAYEIVNDSNKTSTSINLNEVTENKYTKLACKVNQNDNLESSKASMELELKIEPDMDTNSMDVGQSLPQDVKSEMDEVTEEEVNIEKRPALHAQHTMKRKHSSNYDAEDTVLRCDLCGEHFPSAAEWIKHIQSMHMETEQEPSQSTPQEPSQSTAEHSSTPEAVQPLLVPFQSQKLSQKHLTIQPLPPQDASYEEVVPRKDYYDELRKYYNSQSQLSTKPEWTSDRVNQVINLIERYKYPPSNRQKTSQQYHYASKYDVVYTGDLKYLVTKPKSGKQVVKQILPSEEYYDHILHVHLLTKHGGRDKVVRNLKQLYVIPQFAIMILLNLCKHCKLKKSKSTQNVFPVEGSDLNQELQASDALDIHYQPSGQSSLSSD